MAALEIRKDRTPPVLRKLAQAMDDARIARRILAIANALDGISRDAAARSAGMDRQTLRDRGLRYNARGIEGLADRWNGGRPPAFTPEEQAEIVEIVLAGRYEKLRAAAIELNETELATCQTRGATQGSVSDCPQVPR
jgi:transposase